MHHVTMTGPLGELRWSYHRAAEVGPWTMVSAGAGATLTAPVRWQDDVRVSQRPLTFVVARPQGAWRYPVQTLQITGGTITATLGPPEE